MAERYSRLFTLPENLYAEGSPVIIAAGALLKDNQTGKVLAQLKLRSISEKDIQAVKVCLYLFDTAGCPIGEPVMFDYLDLRALRDAEFGQKTPVMVPESKARSYIAAVTEVVFSDKSTWTADGAEWEALPRQRTLEGVFQDTELVKQYKIAVGSNFSYYPMQEKGLWFCACGAVNRVGKPCHVCGRTLTELQAIDREQLVRDKDARLAEEARQAAEEKAATDAKRKKTAKILKIAIPAVCAVIAFLILLNSVILPATKEKAVLKKLEQDYNAAVALMDAGQYEEAIAVFESLGNYRDSLDRIAGATQEIAYRTAIAALKSGDFDNAYSKFSEIGVYKDSAEQIKEVKYQKAISILNANNTAEDSWEQQEAYDLFSEIAEYKDSSDYLQNFVTRCISRNEESLLISEQKSMINTYYDKSGNVAVFHKIYSDGRNYTYIKNNMEQYGNWFVDYWDVHFWNKKENTSKDYSSISVSYLSPYSPVNTESPRTFISSSSSTKMSIESVDARLIISVVNGEITTTYTFYETGSYEVDIVGGTYPKNVTKYEFQTDEKGSVLSKVITEILSYRSGEIGTIAEKYDYTYDANGNYISVKYAKSSNNKWVSGSEKTITFELKYDQDDRLISRVSDSSSVQYAYAKVYCPSARSS